MWTGLKLTLLYDRRKKANPICCPRALKCASPVGVATWAVTRYREYSLFFVFSVLVCFCFFGFNYGFSLVLVY
jgi:hypothetical protein